MEKLNYKDWGVESHFNITSCALVSNVSIWILSTKIRFFSLYKAFKAIFVKRNNSIAILSTMNHVDKIDAVNLKWKTSQLLRWKGCVREQCVIFDILLNILSLREKGTMRKMLKDKNCSTIIIEVLLSRIPSKGPI